MNKIKKSITIDPEILELIRDRAKKERTTVSHIIEVICAEAFEVKEGKWLN